MVAEHTSKKGITPPKGRPTRARGAGRGDRRIFGPTAQWIAVVVVIAALFVILLLVTDGPFGGNGTTGAPAVDTVFVQPSSSLMSIGSLSQPM